MVSRVGWFARGVTMTVGFRIRQRFDRVSKDWIERYRPLPVANVSDCMSRLAGPGAGLQPMHRDGVLCGPALTVRTRSGDNLMLHKAIDMAQPGDVIVVDGGGETTQAVMGELMLAHAIHRGVAGFVVNGAIRDAAAIFEVNLPLYAAGVSHRGPYRAGPGEIGFAIAIGGMIIEPGDLMLGDRDGVVAVPRASVEEVYKGTLAKNAAEVKQMAATKAGTLDRAWVDRALKEAGCVFVD